MNLTQKLNYLHDAGIEVSTDFLTAKAVHVKSNEVLEEVQLNGEPFTVLDGMCNRLIETYKEVQESTLH